MRKRGLGAAAGAAVALSGLLISGCAALGVPTSSSSGSSIAGGRASGSSASPTSPSVSPSSGPRPNRSSASSAPTSSNGRPLSSVPDVKPPGFVSPPPGSGLSRYTRQRFDWKPCHTDEQCATVKVPLDYSDPNGQAITLAVARKPSTAKKSLGTLFINPGGPGASGVDFVKNFRATDLRAYDILGWDPRGVGASTPVECFAGDEMRTYTEMDSSPDTPKEERAWQAENRGFGRSCLQKSGALLEHVSTEETVRDLDVLRQIARSPKLDYFGFSYGTSIGTRYAQLFPASVGRMVLDGAVSLSVTSTGTGGSGGSTSGGYSTGGVSQAEGFDRALNDFATWCATHDSRLGKTKKAVLRQITGLWDDLDRRPLRDGSRSLTQSLAVTGTTLLLYDNATYYKYLETAFSRAIFDQDGSALIFYADQYNDRSKDGSYGQFNYAFPAIKCLDNTDDGIKGALADWKQDEKDAPTFGRYFGPDFTCPTWPVAAKLYRDGSPTAAGAAPIIVVGTTRDPATPYEGAKAMARQLSSGVLVTLKGEGHTAYNQSACIRANINPYLLHGTVPAAGTTCSS